MARLRARWLLLLSRLLQMSLPGDDRDAAELAIALRDFRSAQREVAPTIRTGKPKR